MIATEETSTERLTIKGWPSPSREQRLQKVDEIVARDRLMHEGDAALVEQMAILVLRIDDGEARFVEGEMALEEGQYSAPDRAEADQDDRTCNRAMHGPLRHSFISRQIEAEIEVSRGREDAAASGRREFIYSARSRRVETKGGFSARSRVALMTERSGGLAQRGGRMRRRRPVALDQPFRAMQGAGREFEAEETRFVDRTRQDEIRACSAAKSRRRS